MADKKPTPVSAYTDAQIAALPVINLDELAQPRARIQIFAALHPVLPADGNAFDLYVQLKSRAEQNPSADPTIHVQLLRTIVAQCVPSLTTEQVQRLSVDQLMRIATVAVGGVEMVGDAIQKTEKNDDALLGSIPTPAAETTESATIHQRSRTRSGQR